MSSEEARPAEDLDWQPVLAFLPWLQGDAPEVGRFVEGEMLEDGTWTMPYEALSGRAEVFVKELHASGVVVPGIEWSRWLDGAGDALYRDSDGSAVADASLDELRRLLIAHVRSARFNEGHLLELLRSGGMRRILERIQELVA